LAVRQEDVLYDELLKEVELGSLRITLQRKSKLLDLESRELKQLDFHEQIKFDVRVYLCVLDDSSTGEVCAEMFLDFEDGSFLFELLGGFGFLLVLLLEEGVLSFLLFKHLSNNLYILAI